MAGHKGHKARAQTYLGDDTGEARALVAEAVLAGGELTEIPRSLWDDVVPELEDDAAGGLVVNGKIELYEVKVSVRERGKAGARQQDVPPRVVSGARTYEDVGHGGEGS